MLTFSNRELALLIWITIAIITTAFVKSIRPAVANLLKALLIRIFY